MCQARGSRKARGSLWTDMGPSKTLTQARLMELLRYEPATGAFIWMVPRGRVASGRLAGDSSGGRVSIKIDGRLYRAHRLAFLYINGEWPRHEVDHLNGDPADNRWLNLRDVPHIVNTQNTRRARSGSGTGVMGVHLEKRTGRYVARIVVEGNGIHLGTFDSPDAAHAEFIKAKRALHVGNTL